MQMRTRPRSTRATHSGPSRLVEILDRADASISHSVNPGALPDLGFAKVGEGSETRTESSVDSDSLGVASWASRRRED